MPPGVLELLATQLVADGYLSETLGHYRFTTLGLEMSSASSAPSASGCSTA